MNRRGFLRAAGAGLCASALANRAPASARRPAARPNVLFIWTDQQTAAAMGNAGNAGLRTPAMDSLAQRGVAFERAYCSNPICVPSRTSWITGRMPHETTVTFNTRAHAIEEAPISKLMREHGYDTGYVGKWHIPHPIEDTAWHGFDFVRDVGTNGTDPGAPAACAEFLDRQRERPFFLVASFVNPHDVCEWARLLAGQHELLPNGPLPTPPPGFECPPLPANFAVPDHEPEVIRRLQSLAAARTYPTQGWSEDRWRQYRWGYYRLIEKVDAGIAQVLTTLRATGAEHDTLIIFSSDHGDGAGAHHWNQKTLFYDECARVPFIVCPPGLHVAARRDAQNLVNMNLDFFPTVFDYAGIPTPVNLEGRSVRPLVEGRPGALGHEFVISQNDLAPKTGQSGGVRGRMLRSSRYKYVRYSEGQDAEQLFDLELDPGEMRDLKYDLSHATILAEHRTRLDRWLREHRDPFPAI
jgi:arylsulfatase A-like enzyme|uniref:sulfatase family protein n=1 Tax=Cephaloticoccus sp. TaxID=1985742 RepID=UPI0040499B0B